MWELYTLTLEEIQSILIKSNQLREIVHHGNWHFKLADDALLQTTFEAISYNSKAVDKDTLFFCKGETFKEDYLKEATERGASFYVSERIYEDVDATAIIVNDIRIVMAEIAKAFYGRPDERIKVIGITGTKGKTTTAYLLKSILESYHPSKTAIISTIEIILDGKTPIRASLTTPEAMDLFQMIAQAVDNGMEYLVMEVSSQAYKMNRVHGLRFDVGAFLNISPDHIGPNEHPTIEDYFYCKSRLMANSDVAILNTALDHLDYLVSVTEDANNKVVTYGSDKKSEYSYIRENETPKKFEIIENTKESLGLSGDYDISMLGSFNKENAVCAALAAKLVGADQEAIKLGIKETRVEGRMEHFTYGSNEIYVDFAHNYISLKNLFDYVQDEHPEHKLTIILGAPGNKGVSRRKDMGEVLSLYEGKVILTEDDPNFESVRDISEEIAAAIDGPIQVEFNDDREEAINSALKQLHKDTKHVIVLAAKGSDTYLLRHGKKEDYIGDHRLVEEFLKQKSKGLE